MRRLRELASIIRSKNAGPFLLTFDVIFTDRAIYEQVKRAQVFTREILAARFGLSPDAVLSIHAFDPAMAFKFTMARWISSGTVGDTDVFGAQQHAPLLDLEVPQVGGQVVEGL